MPNIDQVQLPDGSQYNLKDNISGYVTAGYVDDAIGGLTKANVGLGNVDNTSDLNKPVSTAQQTALNGKTDTTVIAPTEATTTASGRYEIGEQFILNGALYTTTAVIASGDSIIVGTNCELSESITEQIKEINDKTKHGLVELWTNPNPTSSFAGQTINISQSDLDDRGLKVNINDIDAVDVEFEISEISVLTIRGRVGARIQPTYTAIGTNNGKVSMSLRQIQVSRANNTISLVIMDCTNYQVNTYGSAPATATQNNHLIPTIITGLIHNS